MLLDITGKVAFTLQNASTGKKVSWIGWAVATTMISYNVYRALVPPSRLPSLPVVNPFSFLLSYMRSEPPTERSQRLLLPTMEKQGCQKAYMVRDEK